MKQMICIGTYTEDILFGTGQLYRGQGKGLTVCSFEDGNVREIGTLPVRNPSFLSMHPNGRKLYCVNEMKEYRSAFGGGVTEITIGPDGSMKAERDFNTGGTDPCHIETAPDASFVVVSNFASGAVTVFYLNEKGEMTGERDFFQHEGSSVDPVRQKGPHAHSASFAPDRKRFYVPDLGLDRVCAYSYESGRVERTPEQDASVSPGSGPRYGEFDRAGKNFYLINEIGSSVTRFSCRDGELTREETAGTLPKGFTGHNTCSDLHVSADGRFLYASNRGHDSIAVFEIREDGSLGPVRLVPCGGRTPRNFCVDPAGKYLLVGNQESDGIAVFETGPEGALSLLTSFLWKSPVCIRFLG